MRAVTQRRPIGPDWPIDLRWKNQVIEEMRRRGWSHSDLAERVGSTRAAISYLLSPTKTWQSKLVPAIHRILEWPPPTSATSSDDLDAIRRLWPELTAEQKLLVTNLAEQMTKKK